MNDQQIGTGEQGKTLLSRREFLKAAAAGAAGAAAAGALGACATADFRQSGAAVSASHQTTDPSQAVWPVVEEVEVHAAGARPAAYVAAPIPAGAIVATHEVDVVVCGLGPAGDAAALSCAEAGLKTVAVEKLGHGNYASATIGGTDSRIHKHWGMKFDKDEWIKDAVVDCAFTGDMELYRHWLSITCD